MITSICDVCKKDTPYQELAEHRHREFPITMNETVQLCDLCKGCYHELLTSLNVYRASSADDYSKRMKAHVTDWIANHTVEETT